MLMGRYYLSLVPIAIAAVALIALIGRWREGDGSRIERPVAYGVAALFVAGLLQSRVTSHPIEEIADFFVDVLALAAGAVFGIVMNAYVQRTLKPSPTSQ